MAVKAAMLPCWGNRKDAISVKVENSFFCKLDNVFKGLFCFHHLFPMRYSKIGTKTRGWKPSLSYWWGGSEGKNLAMHFLEKTFCHAPWWNTVLVQVGCLFGELAKCFLPISSLEDYIFYSTAVSSFSFFNFWPVGKNLTGNALPLESSWECAGNPLIDRLQPTEAIGQELVDTHAEIRILLAKVKINNEKVARHKSYFSLSGILGSCTTSRYEDVEQLNPLGFWLSVIWMCRGSD